MNEKKTFKQFKRLGAITVTNLSFDLENDNFNLCENERTKIIINIFVS